MSEDIQKCQNFLFFKFLILHSYNQGVINGLSSRLVNLDKRGPPTTVRGPLANTQKKLEEWWWIRVWMAKLKPKIIENNPKNTQKQLAENQKNAKTEI